MRQARACSIALRSSLQIVVGSFGETSGNIDKLWAVRFYRKAIFGDDFESGDERLWSNDADPL
ncbi:MAG: hypothetical protein ABI639_08665 [Thermoanaerobaculia bacterium]